MVDEIELSSVLREFARTLVTDLPIQDILDHLVEQIVGVLPVTSAGVTLIGEGRQPRYVAASDASALRYEHLQSTLGEGPCVAAFDSGEPVALPDLNGEERFPAFATAARAAGLGAVFTFPLHHGEHRLGALDLQDRLQHAAQRTMRSHERVAALFIDLDGFKRVNDTHGHHTGDELLVAVARRLAGVVRADDTLARVSGDEFVLLCENLADRSDAELLVRRIEESFREPFDLNGSLCRQSHPALAATGSPSSASASRPAQMWRSTASTVQPAESRGQV